MKKFSINKIINMSMSKLMNTKRNALRTMYSTLNKKRASIVDSFKKHGRESELPTNLTRKVNSNKLSNAELVQEIGNMSNALLSNKYSSYSAWRKDYMKGKRKYAEFIGKKKVSDAEYDKYRQFMSDMYEMHKNDMDPSDLYNESNDIYLLSKRLNLNPNQFTDNLEKWSKRLEELNEEIDTSSIRKGEELDLDIYSDSFSKVASWLEED